MTIPTLLALILMILGQCYIGWILFVSIPSDLTSIFRYKMWRVRDEAVDKIIFENCAEADHQTVAMTSEILIMCAEKLTVAKCLSFLAACFCAGGKQSKPVEQPPKETRELKHPNVSRFARIFIVRVLTSSLSGWVALLPVLLIIGCAHVIGKATRMYRLVSQVLESAFGIFLQNAPTAQSLKTFPMG